MVHHRADVFHENSMIQRMGRTGRKRVGKVIVLVTEGEEERKLKKCVQAAQTLNRALTTRKDRFDYASSPSMVQYLSTPSLS